MAEEYRNHGPVAKAGSMRDVTINSNHFACEINQQRTTTIYNNGISLSTVQPKKIAFKNVPKPHRAFIGRVEYIKMAIKYLTRPVTADVQIQFPCLVIHALGGYGKTQTARKIASICCKKRKFQHFIWIDSEDDMSVKKCFVEAMKQVGLISIDASDATDFDSLMHQFYNLLTSQSSRTFLTCRTKEKFLLIFDNVEDFDKILKFLPLNHRASNFAVLMTSQRRFTQESYGYVRNQPLDLMLEKEAIELVEKILGTIDSEQDKKLLVERSGRIALVLCVMSSTIKYLRRSKNDYSLKDYLKDMRETPIIQHSDDSNTLDLAYTKSLEKVVRFAAEKLNAVGGPIERIAVEIFDRLAYCSSDNWITEDFVQNYFRDIWEDAKNVDMKLPIQPIGYVQIFRLAIVKLSEFSLAQISGNELTVHRLVQASRRLDLKGNERTILKKLLDIVPDMRGDRDENISNIWQHMVDDCPDLIHEYYTEKRTLMKFPTSNVDLLEKIIRGLTQSADFEPLGNYFKEIEKIIYRQIGFFNFNLNAVKCIVNVFNYDVRKISTELLTKAISINSPDIDAVEWLLNEKSCIPKEDHLRKCSERVNSNLLGKFLRNLKLLLNVDIIEDNQLESTFWRNFKKLRWLCCSPIPQRITKIKIVNLLSTLADSDPLKIRICQIIEKNCGNNVLERILHCEPIDFDDDRPNMCMKWFKILRCMLSALEKLEPSTELDDLMEKYAENSLFECLFICERTHFRTKPDKLNMNSLFMNELNWNDLHRAAYRNDVTDTYSIDPTVIESRDRYGMTPLMIAAEYGSCEATTVLLERHSANVNAIDNNEMTPLMYAIRKLYPSICNILLSHGAKTLWMTESGTSRNALHQAVQSLADYDCPESEEIVVALLTSKDCDVRPTDDVGNNVLHLLVRHYYATRYKPNHRMLHLIVSANATLVDIENDDGFTPLLLAKGLRGNFIDDHWHVASLQSFITEVDKVIRRNKVT